MNLETTSHQIPYPRRNPYCIWSCCVCGRCWIVMLETNKVFGKKCRHPQARRTIG